MRLHLSSSDCLGIIHPSSLCDISTALVPVLLRGIADPSSHTNTCLQELLATEFVHIVDAPSLALIMPILQQALGLRSSDGKKMAAQIIGNMYSLTEPKDLSPYLIGILPGLKESLVDPVPDVRSNSAVALGAMVKGLGDEAMTDLLPWLFSTLQSENSSVDRQGAAQGLSEVIRAQGPEHLHTMMPKFVSAVMNTDALPHVRDGYLMLFVYLPAVMAEDFLPHVGSIIPCILQVMSCDGLMTGNLPPRLYIFTFDRDWRMRVSLSETPPCGRVRGWCRDLLTQQWSCSFQSWRRASRMPTGGSGETTIVYASLQLDPSHVHCHTPDPSHVHCHTPDPSHVHCHTPDPSHVHCHTPDPSHISSQVLQYSVARRPPVLHIWTVRKDVHGEQGG